MKAETPLLTSALETEIVDTSFNANHPCPLISAEVEAVPSLPDGWVRLHLVLPDYFTLQVFGEADVILAALIKRRRGFTSTFSNCLDYWHTLGQAAPPRLAQWPGASLFWASPPDEKQGRFAVYSIPQNCGIQYLAGYEGPNAQADDNADYGNLSGTPAGAANHGFPTHWHHNSRAAWDLFLATVKTVQPFGESTAA